jgi:hypothetical protein
LKISSALFLKATIKENTEEAYQQFLDKHAWANERFIAIQKRDSLAYIKKQSMKIRVVCLSMISKIVIQNQVIKAKIELLIEYKISTLKRFQTRP